MKHFTHFKSSILRGLLSLFFLTAMVSSAWGEEATMAAGANGSAAIVNEKDAIKVGTSKAGGDMTITVPAGAISLELYAAAWNGVTGLSLNITPADKVDKTSIALTADTGISGNSPFTLSGTESNYKFTLQLTNITAETKLNLTSSDAKRFVVWGATYSSVEDPRTAVNISTFTTVGSVTSIVKGNTLGTSATNDQNDWTASYTYSSDNTSVATVDNDGTITAVAKGSATITASLNIANNDANYKAGTTTSKSIDITVTNPTHNAVFSANGTTVSEENVEEGSNISFPAETPGDVNGKKFVGWYDKTYSNPTTAPTYVESATMGTQDVTYYAVYAQAVVGGEIWAKTAASNVTAGTYAIITTDGHAFNGTISSGNGQVTSEAFIFDNGIATVAPEGTLEITVSTSGNGYTMYNKDKGYLYASAASSGNLAWHNTESSYWLYESNNWTYYKNTAYLRDYQNSSIRTYGKNNGAVIQFAKKDNGVIYSEFCTSLNELISIEFGGELSKSVYYEEEEFNPEGITVLARYKGVKDPEDVTSQAELSYSNNPLTFGTTNINVSASYLGFNTDKDFAITVNRIPTYDIIASASEGGSYTIKIGDNDEINVPTSGTTYQSRSEKVIWITATPDTHFALSEITVKKSDNSEVAVTADPDDINRVKFVMPQSPVIVSASFTEISQHYVTFSANGISAMPISYYEGEDIDLSAVPTYPTGVTFVGWTEQEIVGIQDNAPTLVTKASMSSQDIIYYAVFATSYLGSRLGKASSLEDGDEVVLATASNDNPTTGVTGWDSKKDATLSDNKEDWMVFTVVSDENGTYLKNNNDEYLKPQNSTFLLDSDEKRPISITQDGELLYTYSSTNYKLAINDAYCRFYAVSTIISKSYPVFYIWKSCADYSGYCTTIPQMFSATIAECGYTTVCLPYNATVEEGASAYALSEITAHGLVFTPVTAIKANEGYLIKGTVSQTYTLTESQESNDATNILKGVTDRVEVSTLGIQGSGAYAYPWILAKDGTFKKYTGGFIPANKAYLDGSYVATYVSLTSNSSELRVIFSDELGNETGMPEIDDNGEVPLIIYTMTGVRIPKVVEDGLYIVNGKTKWMIAE